MSKLHLYGWDWVKQHIPKLPEDYILIDNAEKYFFNSNCVTIYDNWFCIIHHTISDFSTNNLINLFKNKKFIRSLPNCKCIITMSYYNKEHIVKLLNRINLNIPIEVVYHPIYLDDTNNNFVYDKFLENQNKSIINIGAWLRNPFSIYTLNLPKISLKKLKLKGPKMSEYFIPTNTNIRDLIIDILDGKLDVYLHIHTHNLNISDQHNTRLDHIIIDILDNYSRPNNNTNYFITYLVKYCEYLKTVISNNDTIKQHIIQIFNSTLTLDHLNDDEYKKLFIQNIIFENYDDCSASNTILECIAFNTPIIVNSHPAIIEYLGPDYPLYYDAEKYDIEGKFNLEFDNEDISRANKYLQNLDKSKFSSKTFYDDLNKIFTKYSDESFCKNIIIVFVVAVVKYNKIKEKDIYAKR